MSRFFIAIVLCTLLYACKPGIPKNIIQPAEMEKVLYDMHVVDGYATTLNTITTDSLKKIISPYYKGVYKKHGIDSARYTQSLNYYYKHPEVMKLMYDHVTDKLSKARDKAAKMATAAVPVAKLDSLKSAPAKVSDDKSVTGDTIKRMETVKQPISNKAVVSKSATAKKADTIKRMETVKPATVKKPIVKSKITKSAAVKATADKTVQ